ncbi:hypothetical protein [Lichenifustis flavocetrariae]|uniref:Cysteine rich repeat-containing protein n=1 Tax=Lichenifustis flavocetrariae TaxID=2949735 RepID=A0AA41YYU6_9HYPH|nr:hypothetical protein [Lichenifustis flavocetrariae]MCW6510629.1 hypothetical protein [Lichenifustis flavocetrariae]
MRPISLFVTALALLGAQTAFAATNQVSLKDKQQAACYDDVNRLCKDAIPDVDKVTACMKDKKPLVSAKCAAMWDVK